MNFDVVIGIENHVELKTKNKIFSRGKASLSSVPNSHVNENDLGLPGLLPIVNKKCVELGILVSSALDMEIDNILRFDRKNYYYPDLPKGFQITQYYHPLGKEGKIDIIDDNGVSKIIGIERLHLEEDTAKQIHQRSNTLLDYNRAGIGLIEIVSRPELNSAAEAVSYIENLREIILFTGASDVKMNEGSFRCDINISLKPKGSEKLGTKVEIKNLNSINNVKKAIEFEIKRQQELILKGETIISETRRFDENLQKTVCMRVKGDDLDYRYFPEPNIIPIELDMNWIKAIIKNKNKLPSDYREIYVQKYGLNIKKINQLLKNPTMNEFFFKTCSTSLDKNKVLNYLLGTVSEYLNQNKIEFYNTKLSLKNLEELISLIEQKLISNKQGKEILICILQKDTSPKLLIKDMNIQQISDYTEIEKLLEKAISDNQDLLRDYKNRPERVEKFFMGKLMKETRGQVDPVLGKEIMHKLILKHIE